MKTVVAAVLLCLSVHPNAQNAHPKVLQISEQAVATLNLPGYPDSLAADDNAVWVTNQNRIEKLVLGSPKPVLAASIPEPCGAMVVAFDSVWVASCREKSVFRVDKRSGAILANIHTGLAEPEGELSLAAGAGSVWVLSDDSGVLSGIDASTNKVAKRIRVEPHSYAAAFGFGRVWVTNTGAPSSKEPGSVQCIDPQTGRATATIKVGPVPRFLAAGADGVWTLNQGDGSVTRIDPTTMQVVATIPTGVVGAGGDIDAGAKRVWVRGKDILLKTIDSRTNTISSHFGPRVGSGAVRVAGDLVWVSAHDVSTVWVLRASNVP